MAALGCSTDAFDKGVNLGIAMQMTNIARDVLEDARQVRRYLPAVGMPKQPNWTDLETMSPG